MVLQSGFTLWLFWKHSTRNCTDCSVYCTVECKVVTQAIWTTRCLDFRNVSMLTHKINFSKHLEQIVFENIVITMQPWPNQVVVLIKHFCSLSRTCRKLHNGKPGGVNVSNVYKILLVTCQKKLCMYVHVTSSRINWLNLAGQG